MWDLQIAIYTNKYRPNYSCHIKTFHLVFEQYHITLQTYFSFKKIKLYSMFFQSLNKFQPLSFSYLQKLPKFYSYHRIHRNVTYDIFVK